MTRIVAVNATTAESFWALPDQVANELRAGLPAGWDLTIARTSKDFADALREAEIAIGWPFPAAMLKSAARLRSVVFFTRGVPESWLQSPTSGRGAVRVTTMGDESARSVAEHALLLAMSAVRGLKKSSFLAWHRDEYLRPRAAEHMRACVLGGGGVGREIARLVVPVFAGVSVVSRRSPRDLPAPAVFVPASDAARPLGQSDVVFVALPLTPDSRAFVRGVVFPALRARAVVVNVARGPLVDEADLVAFLDRDPESRYATDVAHPEPYPSDGLLYRRDQVLVTAHVAARREDAWVKIGARVVAALDREIGDQT
jgi:phosphoglycerate dehydrogenase-like enzyme